MKVAGGLGSFARCIFGGRIERECTSLPIPAPAVALVVPAAGVCDAGLSNSRICSQEARTSSMEGVVQVWLRLCCPLVDLISSHKKEERQHHPKEEG